MTSAADTAGAVTVPAPTQQLELSIGGMTCASCAARIEKKLNRLDGVTATVNYATEIAQVRFPDTVQPGDLVAEVKEGRLYGDSPATTVPTRHRPSGGTIGGVG